MFSSQFNTIAVAATAGRAAAAGRATSSYRRSLHWGRPAHIYGGACRQRHALYAYTRAIDATARHAPAAAAAAWTTHRRGGTSGGHAGQASPISPGDPTTPRQPLPRTFPRFSRTRDLVVRVSALRKAGVNGLHAGWPLVNTVCCAAAVAERGGDRRATTRIVGPGLQPQDRWCADSPI